MSLRVLAAASATTLVGVAIVLVGPASPAVAGQAGHLVYTTPGSIDWTVPAGVTGAVFTVDGAAGGAETTYVGTTTLGGKGGRAAGFVSVTPGETFGLTVGSAGPSVQGWYSTYANGGQGGVPGGGNGGGGTDPGAGGGGESVVVQGGSYVLIGAGGGGATAEWSQQSYSAGGDGGGLTGSAGSWINTDPRYGSATGGTQTAGGAGAQNNYNTGQSSGGYGFGGTGGSAPSGWQLTSGGGGGGGGFYGGGGAGASGGGGGSSYLSPNVFSGSTSTGVDGGNGSITIDFGTADSPTIDQNPLPLATAGVEYSHTFTATGWPAASFTAVGGSLPAGLQLSADGVLSGTLTRAGTYSFTIGAYNAEAFASRDVQLVVDAGPATSFTAGVGSPTGGSGTAQAGGAAQLVASVTDAWGNPAPGSIEFGLPARGPWKFIGGNRTATVPLDDTGQASAYVDLGAHLGTFTATATALGTSLAAVTDKVKVVPAPGGMDGGGTQQGGLVNKPYDDPLTVFGVPVPTVTVHSGSLPPGLTLSGFDISGTPTRAGTYAFVLRVDNGAESGPVDVPCTIAISRTPTVGIEGGSVAPPVPGQLFQFSLPVTLSAPAAVPVTVRWNTKHGTGISPRDFVAGGGVVTIPAGQTSGSVTVQARGHVSGLAPRTFSVVLSAPSNARIVAPNGTATCTVYYD